MNWMDYEAGRAAPKPDTASDGRLVVMFVFAVFYIWFLLILPRMGHAAEYRSATWYADHPTQRFQVNTACKDWPGEAHRNTNCENAFQGGLIADARAAESHMGGAANIGGPSIAWWQAHPQNRDYWANQCRIAMRHNEKPETLAGMWCPSVLAAGG